MRLTGIARNNAFKPSQRYLPVLVPSGFPRHARLLLRVIRLETQDSLGCSVFGSFQLSLMLRNSRRLQPSMKYHSG
jgi:hypothetical protein